MDTTKIPPELVAFMEGVYAASPDDAEARALTEKILPIIWQTVTDIALAAVAGERERCAVRLDALAAEEKKGEDYAERGSGHHTVARAMRKAYERGAAVIRSGEG